jgi:hypothetical protein
LRDGGPLAELGALVAYPHLLDCQHFTVDEASVRRMLTTPYFSQLLVDDEEVVSALPSPWVQAVEPFARSVESVSMPAKGGVTATVTDPA